MEALGSETSSAAIRALLDLMRPLRRSKAKTYGRIPCGMQSFRVELLKLDPRLPVIGGMCSVWSLSWQVLPGSLALFKGYIYI